MFDYTNFVLWRVFIIIRVRILIVPFVLGKYNKILKFNNTRKKISFIIIYVVYIIKLYKVIKVKCNLYFLYLVLFNLLQVKINKMIGNYLFINLIIRDNFNNILYFIILFIKFRFKINFNL